MISFDKIILNIPLHFCNKDTSSPKETKIGHKEAKADETSTYGWSRFGTVNYRPSVRKFPTQGPGFEPQTSEVGGECYHCTTVAQKKNKRNYNI